MVEPKRKLRSQIRNGLEVLQLSACGYTDRQVSERLSIAPETIRSRMKTFYGVVRARNRQHALAIALTNGWLDVSDIGWSIHNLQPERIKRDNAGIPNDDGSRTTEPGGELDSNGDPQM